MKASLFSFSIWLNVFSVTYGASIRVAACAELISPFGVGAAACFFCPTGARFTVLSLVTLRLPPIPCAQVPGAFSCIQLHSERRLLTLLVSNQAPDQGY